MVDVYPRSAHTPEIVHFSSTDTHQTHAVLNRFYSPLKVGVPDDGHEHGFAATVIQLGPLTVGQGTFAGPVTLRIPDMNAYHVSIPTEGRMRSWHAGQVVELTASTGVVFGPGTPVHTAHDAGSTTLGVKIE